MALTEYFGAFEPANEEENQVFHDAYERVHVSLRNFPATNRRLRFLIQRQRNMQDESELGLIVGDQDYVESLGKIPVVNALRAYGAGEAQAFNEIEKGIRL